MDENKIFFIYNVGNLQCRPHLQHECYRLS
nr:MAG TPA: hypothetical protein [Caudoviricetes sp.]